nr:F0F1 ATP synthase subunit gamma [Candidatus Kuenenia stuttgartiensis]
MVSDLISSLPQESAYRWFAKKESVNSPVKVILITADKGLCGAYNNNIIQKQ